MVKRKRNGFSTSTRTNVSILTSDGDLQHSTLTLNQLRMDRLATEKERGRLILGLAIGLWFDNWITDPLVQSRRMQSTKLSSRVPCKPERYQAPL